MTDKEILEIAAKCGYGWANGSETRPFETGYPLGQKLIKFAREVLDAQELFDARELVELKKTGRVKS